MNISSKELITLLHRMQVETGSLVCLGCGHEHGCNTRGCALIREAADRLDTMQREWVSVDDMLPEMHKDVLALYTYGKIIISWRNSDDSWPLEKLYGPVTHWMLLPGLPERETSGGNT